MKNMYFIKAKIVGFQYNITNWQGGNTEEQAIQDFIASTAKFYDVKPHNIQVESIKNQGAYEKVLAELMRG
jgi:hypothetical protein